MNLKASTCKGSTFKPDSSFPNDLLMGENYVENDVDYVMVCDILQVGIENTIFHNIQRIIYRISANGLFLWIMLRNVCTSAEPLDLSLFQLFACRQLEHEATLHYAKVSD